MTKEKDFGDQFLCTDLVSNFSMAALIFAEESTPWLEHSSNKKDPSKALLATEKLRKDC